LARSHVVSEEAPALLVRGDERGFVNARRRTLDDLEQRALDSHLAALD
jgi:hypothetical protein